MINRRFFLHFWFLKLKNIAKILHWNLIGSYRLNEFFLLYRNILLPNTKLKFLFDGDKQHPIQMSKFFIWHFAMPIITKTSHFWIIFAWQFTLGTTPLSVLRRFSARRKKVWVKFFIWNSPESMYHLSQIVWGPIMYFSSL